MAKADLCRAFWATGPGRGEIRTAPLAPRARGERLVTARFSAVSRGTESLVFHGRVPVGERDRMRCPFQDGEFPFPVKYGYASVGIDDSGRRVFCLYPHQDRYLVPDSALLPVPDAVPDRRAALAANMETAVNILWDAGPLIGDAVAVVGGGVVGCFVAALAARLPGAKVTLVDTNPDRATLAVALGAAFATPATVRPGADLVVHTSGQPAGLQTALDLAADEATVVEASWYGTETVPLRLGERFHSGRLTLRSSQVGMVAPARRGRRSHRDRLALALRLLADPVFDRLLTGETAFADLPAAMPALTAAAGPLAHLVRYD
ncbi:MAG: zinc-binding alcohol dehydrogenase [Alphaproteobacteria bacterium]